MCVEALFYMKKRSGISVALMLVAAALIVCSVPTVTASAAAPAPELASPSFILTEAETGTVLCEHNAREHRPIASMVKIMTLLLTFENIGSGALSETEMITASENAASMGGSQAYLDAHAEYEVGELIKSVAVASANDSCVALAERISGSVDGFVAEMNEKAKQLGMEDTNFVNCTGLPAPNQYSCVRDAAVMFGELIRYDGFFGYSCVWMFDFAHPSGRKTALTNTNKMIRSYEGCDGGKTGFTNEARYCLSATAKRGDTRLVGVIAGAESSAKRNAEMAELFDYGFANYEVKQVIFGGAETDVRYEAEGSREGSVGLAPASDGFYLSERGEGGEIGYRVELDELPLPIEKGATAGRIYATVGGRTVAESELVTTGELNEKTYLDVLKDILDRM